MQSIYKCVIHFYFPIKFESLRCTIRNISRFTLSILPFVCDHSTSTDSSLGKIDFFTTPNEVGIFYETNIILSSNITIVNRT